LPLNKSSYKKNESAVSQVRAQSLNLENDAANGWGNLLMGDIEFGIWLQPTTAPDVVARWARLAEDQGFSFVGITDGQNIWRDAWVCLTAAALATKRIRLGTWVTNPFTRHPTVTINAACTLDELSGGRAFIGIGMGDDSVRTIGHREAKLDELASVIGLMRRLSVGEYVDTDNGRWHLATARPNGVDIYWAAANPRSTQHGGQYSDGVIVSAWLVPELLEKNLANIRIGMARSGARPRVASIFNSCVAIDEDGSAALAAAKPYVARALCYTASAEVPGWSKEDMERFKSQYNYYDHFAPSQGIATAVPDHMITKKAVAGTPEECVDLMQIVIDSGFDRIALIPMTDPEKSIRLLGERVLPKLRKKR
jgi:5,10-methylenetetrahydromethanopterin reductase